MTTKLSLRWFTGIIISLVLILAPVQAWAGLEDEMHNLFNSMVNVNNGGYHMAMGRGTVAGPSVVIRNRRLHTDLINFQAPRIDGGCGGIDMFLGSFSFISAQQFIHLMQSIASNAGGYAFKLALSVMCPSCHQIISNMEHIIRDINRLAGDSCKAAETLVNTAADKIGLSGMSGALEFGPLSSLAQSTGNLKGAFDSYVNKSNAGSATGALTESQVNALLGNIAWKILKKKNYVALALGSDSNELAEALMSISGTLIGYKQDDDEYSQPKLDPKPPILTYKNLLEGGGDLTDAKKYSCDDYDKCLNPTADTYNFTGLQKLINQVLLGSDDMSVDPSSLVGVMLDPTNGRLSDQAKQLIQIAPFHTTRLRNIAVCTLAAGGYGATEQYAKAASGLIALEVLEKYMRDLINGLRAAAGSATDNMGTVNDGSSDDGNNIIAPLALSPKYQEELRKVNKEIQDAHNTLWSAKQQTLEQLYQSTMKSCNVKNLIVRKGG